MDDERLWFVGVDWASEIHQVRLSDVQGTKIGERSFKHGGEGLAELANWLLQLTQAPPGCIHIAIEGAPWARCREPLGAQHSGLRDQSEAT